MENADHDENVPIKYRFSTIDSLYEKFLLESHFELQYNIFYFKKTTFSVLSNQIPMTVIHVCVKCLNPELRLEALANTIQDNCLKWNDTQSYTTIDVLIKKIYVITYKTIHFNE